MTLKYSLDLENYYSSRMGLVVLETDETIEQEMRDIITEKVSIYHTRIPCDKTVTEQNLKKMEEQLPSSIGLLPKIPFDIIGYACTSGATVIGSEKISKIIKSSTNCKSVTDPIKAVKTALTKLECNKIGFVSPYEEKVTEKMRFHLETEGFQIKNVLTFNESDDTLVARISEKDTLNAACEVFTEECEAIFISCTNLKTFKIIDEIEERLSIPVISSNLALTWHMMSLTGEINNSGPGRLFSS
tara:strand:- start:481 stop:1212 length:732 start_codon:yes stop_codon:yes gene_type:complete